MLLIGDIHITTKYTDQIISAIRSHIARFPEEKNVIFMGDYMYMFSYDRRALSALFDLFLELWHQDKNVYILAGNHDWIGQQFVYAEGKKVADVLSGVMSKTGNNNDKKIYFITEPEVHEIEGKEILFFPFSKHLTLPSDISRESTNETIQGLLDSKNSNERLSGEIHLLLDSYIQKHKELTVIHHYYVADTKFPGQQAIFDYKDIALCPELLHNSDIQLISGHIHMPFAYKNYFCTGSIRYTSPLEQDHHKFLYQRDAVGNSIQAHQVAINPYVVLPLNIDEKVSQHTLDTHRKSIDTKIGETFTGKWSVNLHLAPYIYGQTRITLLSENIGYESLQEHIDPELFSTVSDWSIKRKSVLSADMSFTLEIAQKNLQESLIDRKIIVKNFIMSRFGNDFDKYRTLLDELHILS